MKILAIEEERSDIHPAQFQPYLKAEAARLWELTQKGFVREAHFHAEKHVAVLVLECDSVSAASRLLQSLPLVENGLIAFDLLPLVPYDGFARLFASESQEAEPGE